MTTYNTVPSHRTKCNKVSIVQYDNEGKYWDVLLPSPTMSDYRKLYTLSNRFLLDYWKMEFQTFWGRRTHGRQGYFDKVGNFIYGGCFK